MKIMAQAYRICGVAKHQRNEKLWLANGGLNIMCDGSSQQSG